MAAATEVMVVETEDMAEVTGATAAVTGAMVAAAVVAAVEATEAAAVDIRLAVEATEEAGWCPPHILSAWLTEQCAQSLHFSLKMSLSMSQKSRRV